MRILDCVLLPKLRCCFTTELDPLTIFSHDTPLDAQSPPQLHKKPEISKKQRLSVRGAKSLGYNLDATYDDTPSISKGQEHHFQSAWEIAGSLIPAPGTWQPSDERHTDPPSGWNTAIYTTEMGTDFGDVLGGDGYLLNLAEWLRSPSPTGEIDSELTMGAFDSEHLAVPQPESSSSFTIAPPQLSIPQNDRISNRTLSLSESSDSLSSASRPVNQYSSLEHHALSYDPCCPPLEVLQPQPQRVIPVISLALLAAGSLDA
ncbi:hypothetical protein R3P38DRAFT_2962817 [Favolaschia claudopus]|uniref:Uncharacterized protein n=1 Tax=Favolaschia claudopus TaxID=2862362 RepID=A0AAW0B8U5_9AGAR